MKFSVHQELSNYALNLPFDVKHSEKKTLNICFGLGGPLDFYCFS